MATSRARNTNIMISMVAMCVLFGMFLGILAYL